jgi:hypothetical protein
VMLLCRLSKLSARRRVSSRPHSTPRHSVPVLRLQRLHRDAAQAEAVGGGATLQQPSRCASAASTASRRSTEALAVHAAKTWHRSVAQQRGTDSWSACARTTTHRLSSAQHAPQAAAEERWQPPRLHGRLSCGTGSRCPPPDVCCLVTVWSHRPGRAS